MTCFIFKDIRVVCECHTVCSVYNLCCIAFCKLKLACTRVLIFHKVLVTSTLLPDI